MSWWEFWKESKQKNEFVQTYLEENLEKIPGIRSLDQLEFIVLDTETSGFEPKSDSVLSFGAVKIKELKILVNQSVEWYPKSPNSGKNTVAIHGLVAIQNTLSPEEFAGKLLQYLGNGIIVGHHIGFDLEMLKTLLKPYGFGQFKNPVLDTHQFAIRLEHGPLHEYGHILQEEYSLDGLCKRYGIPLDDRHTAAGDAFLTAQLFLKLLAKAKAKGITTYQSLLS